ncbi:hypothetical protein BIV23_15395 [Streptomyces monashensis]|uniref:Uncharacterized protein n=1 Tax=Streptomyces monashensis TaxID=1678012 RepID=A0A1S2QHB7_9ACTN|nr:hypothetical protein BIV23_15395 [Streptomyces monashensis]
MKAQGEEGDVVRAALGEGSGEEFVTEGGQGFAGEGSGVLAQSGQVCVQGFAAAFDQPVGVEQKGGAGSGWDRLNLQAATRVWKIVLGGPD